MIFNNIFMVIFILVVLLSIYFIIKKQARKLWYFLPIYITFFSYITINTINDLSSEYPRNFISVEAETTLDLRLRKESDRNFLYQVDSSEEILVKGNNGELFNVEQFSPIYINETENYYIVVYSVDHTKTILNHRFTQQDIERNNFYDRLVLINKNNHKILNLAEVELIGKTINLNSFQESDDNLLSFNIFLDYETKISTVELIYINYEAIELEFDNIAVQIFNPMMKDDDEYISVNHFHTLNNPSWITDFILKDDFFFYQDSYGKSYIGTIEGDISYSYSNNGQVTSVSGFLYLNAGVNLEDLVYANQGYLKITENGIYYINNDLDIVFYNGVNTTIINEDVSLDSWLDYMD